MKNLEKNTPIVKIKYYLAIAITFLYVFRGLGNKLGIGNATYLFTIVLCAISIISFGSRKCYLHITILLYIFSGIFATFFTFIVVNKNAVLVGSIGYISNYINMFVWLIFFYSLDQAQTEMFLTKYIDIIIVFAVISAIIAIYQTFFDASIAGLAISGIYADEELLASGQYVRRATALFGSAQNYGFYMGAAFCALICGNYKKKCSWFIKLIFILIGIFLSGSRSASSCVIIAIVYLLCHFLKNKKSSKNIIFLGIGILLLAILFLSASQIVSMDTISRLVRFGTSAARKVYQKTLNEINVLILIFGNGIGYKNWTTRQFVGSSIYESAYGAVYSSTESFFMQLLIQLGIFGMISFVILIIFALVYSMRYKKQQISSIILCLIINQIFTPSFAGLAISYIFWPVILFPILQKTQNDQIKKQFKREYHKCLV